MEKLVEKWMPSKDSSFIVKEYLILPNSAMYMRTHDEYEITVITRGSGKRFIGNTIENFIEGDIFILGPHVPHSVQIDENQEGHAITIHFLKSAFGSGFFDIPENSHIKEFLHYSQLGLTLKSKNQGLVEKIKNLTNKNGYSRMLYFFDLLNEIANRKDKKVVSSRGFTKISNNKDYVSVNKTYEYIIKRFENQSISLIEISDHLNMSPSTFCRFFKKHFKKTYTKFINEVRIGHSCKLLQETNKNIAQVAFASGYNHLTHFNKQFKKIMKCSPREYKRELNR